MRNLVSLHRRLCSELVSVARLHGSGWWQAITGNLEEIGERSALILTESAIPRGSKVRVKREGHVLKGVVESCTFDELLGFFVDVRLDWESRWSEQWFAPHHLFDLCSSLRSYSYPPAKVPEKNVLTSSAHTVKNAPRRSRRTKWFGFSVARRVQN